MKTRKRILLPLLLPGLLLAAPGDSEREKPPAEIPVINLWVDLGLGLISEEDAKAKMRPLDADLKSALESETKPLTGDLYGVRQVSGKQFAAIVANMDQVSSFSSTSVIGKTKERWYLEVKIHLTSRHSYVAIVCAPLDDVPVATRNKLGWLLAIDSNSESKEE